MNVDSINYTAGFYGLRFTGIRPAHIEGGLHFRACYLFEDLKTGEEFTINVCEFGNLPFLIGQWRTRVRASREEPQHDSERKT